MERNLALPAHVQFFLPILHALRRLGGSASLPELKEALVELLALSEQELGEKLRTGASRLDNQIAWSKIYLVREGLLDVSTAGVWALTKDGLTRDFTDDDVLTVFKRIHGAFGSKKTTPRPLVDPSEDDTPHRSQLLEVLQSLPPGGFERLCQRLLRSSGFTKVVVSGRSGDGGIDGEGILEISPLVSLKVIFQAKRYKDAVSSSQIRDFRGAMQGRAEKGIFITTGRFTQEAEKEAIREGAAPIELVDGEKLVLLFEQKQLGLKPKVIYEVDLAFFDEYR
jgi:restriction system protein